MHRNIQKMMQNMGKLELRVTALSLAGSFYLGLNYHDPAYREVAFEGFPKQMDSTRCINAISRFMRKHCKSTI